MPEAAIFLVYHFDRPFLRQKPDILAIEAVAGRRGVDFFGSRVVTFMRA